MTDYDFSTRAIRTGQAFDPTTGAVIPPVYFTTTFVQDGIGGFRNGYEYARGKNPTREALERNVATLEGGTHGFAFGSGMGALDSIMKLFKSGDHFVCADNLYGGTPRLFDRILVNFGLTFSYVDCRDPQRIAVQRQEIGENDDLAFAGFLGERRGDDVGRRHQPVDVLVVLVEHHAVEAERVGVSELVDIFVQQAARLLPIPKRIGHGDPAGVVFLVEIGRQVWIGHEVPAEELNGF